MYDLLTLDDLYELHRKLSAEFHANHAKLMSGLTPLINPLSAEWAVLSAKGAEINEAADAVYAEIERRAQEASADV